MLSTHGRHAGGIAGAVFLALLILVGSSWSRGTEYDEGYSVFIAAGTPRPVWPDHTFTAADARGFYAGHSTVAGIAADLRHTDVHPPLYFWSEAAWRGVVGTGLFRTRLLSVLFSLIALGGVAALAIRAGAPPVAAMLVTLGCYGFTYTGSIARGFALAQLCMIWGTVLIAAAANQRRVAPPSAPTSAPPSAWADARKTGIAAAGGVLLGLASFSNYLAAFVGAGALLWLFATQFRRWSLWLAGGLGFACILPLDLYFFLAQRGSRVGQFPPFHLLPSLVRLGKYAAANVFGGLPLYVGHLAGLALGAVLVLALAALVLLIALRWRRLASPMRLLLAMCTLATPAGLLLLGFVFDNTPIELRYIAFATPFFALLLTGAMASLKRPFGHAALVALLCMQAVSLAGLMLRPETMQPQAQAARAAIALSRPGTLVLVPYGNDGVGVLGAFVTEVPDAMRLHRVDAGQSPASIRATAGTASRVIVVLLGLDGDSRAVLGAMQAAFAGQACWRQAATGFDVIAFDRISPCSVKHNQDGS